MRKKNDGNANKMERKKVMRKKREDIETREQGMVEVEEKQKKRRNDNDIRKSGKKDVAEMIH